MAQPGLHERLAPLGEAGVSIWLDTMSRELLESGRFLEYVRDWFVAGATSNPTTFAQAITSSDRYDAQLAELLAVGVQDPQELFFSLALDDISESARVLRPLYDARDRDDGYVSFECTPDVADDTDATIDQAIDLWDRVDAPNVMIKVPGTAAGVPAIEELTARGVNVNVTLLFGVGRYEEVMEAYLSGLERRLSADEPLDHVFSVASFFVSRVDTKVDRILEPSSSLQGRVAVANAKVAYQYHLNWFAGERWDRLRAQGARVQKPLWASTGTKNPEYSDVLYVEELIAPGVINTMPEQTLAAFADHGRVARTLDGRVDEAGAVLDALAQSDVDLEQITAELEREGVEAFAASYRDIVSCVEHKTAQLVTSKAAR